MNFYIKTIFIAVVFIVTITQTALAQNKPNAGYTGFSGIRWVLQSMFGNSYGNVSQKKLTGVRKNRLRDSAFTGVRQRSITTTLRDSFGSSNSRKLLGNRVKIFGGPRHISGFKKSRGYR